MDSDLLDCVIGLGPNLFYGTGISACVLIFRARKESEKGNKILFIDASELYQKGRAQNIFLVEHADAIVELYEKFSDVEGQSKVVEIDEIKEKDPDTLLLDNFAKNIGELHAQIQLETIKHFLEVKKILNENQIEKFELLLSKMNNHQMHMRENNYSQKRNRRYKN